MVTSDNNQSSERGELLQMLAEQRDTLLIPVRGLSDAQAVERTTASELTLAGLIKHVAYTEQGWVRIILGRPNEQDPAKYADHFRMLDGETLAGLIENYAEVARETERVVSGLPDWDRSCPLPEAPWFPPGAAWSVRRILLHLIRETAQHCGHADIIRESLDGASTTMRMGADAGL